jgi:hypothetical protein
LELLNIAERNKDKQKAKAAATANQPVKQPAAKGKPQTSAPAPK